MSTRCVIGRFLNLVLSWRVSVDAAYDGFRIELSVNVLEKLFWTSKYVQPQFCLCDYNNVRLTSQLGNVLHVQTV